MQEFGELVGESPAVAAVRDKLRRLLDRQRASHRLPAALIQGETGTGKGLVARLLHRYSNRGGRSFVDVNCAAIPDGLLEAELFGFEQGAFTDARRAKPGLFQAAHGGVLFLDEVSLLPESLQAKLLTAIEDRAVRRLGSMRPEPADAWIVSATNGDLRGAVSTRRFREDLYHRLTVFTLELPPLRERDRDILLLAERFLARACTDYGLPPKRLDAGAQARLLGYAWPGNIRELANVIERVALFADTAVVTAEMLGPLEAQDGSTAAAASPSETAMSRDEAMREHLLAVLEQTGWNISHTAAQLGIARNTVYAQLDKFGLRARSRKPAVPRPRLPQPPAVVPSQETRLQWERRSIALLQATLSSADEIDNWSQTSRALDAVITKIQSFGGRVEDVSSKTVVAAFGLDPVEDAPRRAALAAIAIQKGAQRARESSAEVAGVKLALHWTPLVVGLVGTRIEIDADAKRAAWRMLDELLQRTAPDETTASAAAAPLLGRRFELTPVDTSENAPGTSYRLTGRERQGLGLWGGMTTFVGRGDELERLKSCLTRARSGHGQVVAVVGEPGVGKSRLLYEFTHSAQPQGWLVLEATAVSYGQAMSHLPVIALLKGYFTIHDRDDLGAIRDKVTQKVLTLDEALAPTLPALLALLDVPVEDAAWRTLDPPQRRRRTLDAVRALVLREARGHPMLIAFEDLHWIDGETQAWLDELVDTVAAAPLLLLLTYRSEYRHTWASKTSYSQIRLDALNPDTAAELLDGLLGDDPGLAPLKSRLVKRGNPFFLEETVRTLVEMKALMGEPGRYRLRQPVHAIEVPATVHAILAARIDRLPLDEKRLLQIASVIGKDVPFRLLQAMAELPDEALSERLTRLRAAEFLDETRLFPDREYSFKHALTHEVTYGGLLQERRRDLHARIVAAIERIHSDRLAEQIERLAHHALRGELGQKTVHYLRQAGQKAHARSALRDAQAWLEQALSVLRTLPESQTTLEQGCDIRIELRDVLAFLGELDLARDHLREAEVLAKALNDERRRGRVCADMTGILTNLGDVDEAVVSGTSALEISARLDDSALRKVATGSLVEAHYHRGDYTLAVELASDNLAAWATDLASGYPGEGRDRRLWLAAFHRSWLLLSLAHLGRFVDASHYEAEAINLDEPTYDASAIGYAYRAAGFLHAEKGEWATAATLFERASATFRSGNVTLLLPGAVSSSAQVLAQLGNATEALNRLREGKRLIQGLPATPRVYAYYSLGCACLLLGELDESQQLAERAAELCSRLLGRRAYALGLLGNIATHPDRFDAERGEASYREALTLAEPRGMRPLVAHCHLGLGKLYRRIDKHEQAHEHLTSATTMYRDMGMTYWLHEAEAQTLQ